MITEGLTPDNFITALNSGIATKYSTAKTDLTAVLISNFHDSYEYIQTIDEEVPAKTDLTIGMSGAAYISTLNANFTKVSSVQPFSLTTHVISDHRGSEYGNLLDQFYEPVIYRLANGKQVIGCLSRGGAMSRENFNIVLNADGTFSGNNLMGFDAGVTGTYDTHGKAAFIEKDGVLYTFFEEMNGVSPDLSSGHGSSIVVKKSVDNGATWEEIARVGNVLSYSKVILIGSTFYLIVREIVATVAYISVFKSTNDCVTWTALTKPVVGPTGYVPYHVIPKLADAIHIIIMERYNTIGTYFPWPHVFHIVSDDGITYYNTERTWSKNVNTGGSITRTELLANCLVSEEHTDDYTTAICGAFVKDGDLYSLIGYGVPSVYSPETSGTGYSKVTFESCKLYKNRVELLDLSDLVTGVVWAGYDPSGSMRLIRNGETFDIIHIDAMNTNDIKLYNYSETELLSKKLLYAGGVSHEEVAIGSSPNNTTSRSNRILVMGKVTGSIHDLLNSYTDLLVFEPNV